MRTSAHWNAENRAKSPESRIRSKLGIPMSSQAIASPSMMQECERRRARSPQCVIGLLILARSHVRVVGEAERFGLLPFARRPRRSQITTKRRLDLNAHTPVVPPPQYGSTIGEFLRADVECNSSFALAWRAAMMNCLVAGRRGNTVAHNHARSPRSLGERAAASIRHAHSFRELCDCRRSARPRSSPQPQMRRHQRQDFGDGVMPHIADEAPAIDQHARRKLR